MICLSDLSNKSLRSHQQIWLILFKSVQNRPDCHRINEILSVFLNGNTGSLAISHAFLKAKYHLNVQRLFVASTMQNILLIAVAETVFQSNQPFPSNTFLSLTIFPAFTLNLSSCQQMKWEQRKKLVMLLCTCGLTLHCLCVCVCLSAMRLGPLLVFCVPVPDWTWQLLSVSGTNGTDK